jgi:hypothetical protein
MKTQPNGKKKVLRFGDFVAGAYRAWGSRRAKGLVWLTVNARLVEFPGPRRFEIAEE